MTYRNTTKDDVGKELLLLYECMRGCVHTCLANTLAKFGLGTITLELAF